ncbi:hypothetical protein [Terribacillus saccharophilus]|uniref:Uncharacterized protein n=1 Tax=Terribacillus saccharophilus TaxID=361277 RepID=A0A268AAV5_9BACI|nr:hypothetical protein [Terribacillus saccharophilus]PAD21263.1 hypothetical protein CHH64_10055 [Terribacillus saccharophilus]
MYELKETDLTAEAYRQLLERLFDICDSVCFAVLPKKMMGQKQTLHRMLQELEPYLREVVYDNGTRCNLFDDHVTVTNYYYRICPESKQTIMQTAENLFHWQQPALPEDLSFMRKGEEYFVTNAHEGYAMLFAEDEQLIELGGTRWKKIE